MKWPSLMLGARIPIGFGVLLFWACSGEPFQSPDATGGARTGGSGGSSGTGANPASGGAGGSSVCEGNFACLCGDPICTPDGWTCGPCATGGGTGGIAGTGGSGTGGIAATGGSGACGTCDIGLECCDGSCVNTGNDINNCGDCGSRCDDTRFCDEGFCKPPPCSGTACLATQFCCGTECCKLGQLCCVVPGPGPTGPPGCFDPTPEGTCPIGCPGCD
jgi:hypothetical protein